MLTVIFQSLEEDHDIVNIDSTEETKFSEYVVYLTLYVRRRVAVTLNCYVKVLLISMRDDCELVTIRLSH